MPLLRVMQGWLFVHSFFFWTTDRAKALLTSVPKVSGISVIDWVLVYVQGAARLDVLQRSVLGRHGEGEKFFDQCAHGK